jgi:hypothetical protein
MAEYNLNSFDATQEQINDLGGDASLINYIKVWDPSNPSGWLVVGIGPTLAQVVCPKPCGSVS